MENFIIYPKSQSQVGVLKGLFEEMGVRYKKISNPSPSNDKYFDNPDNIAELNKRISKQKNKKAEKKITVRSKDELKTFLGL